jgi:hypothetical protein
MFAESSPLIDFIEMPSYRCTGSVLTRGLIELSAMLMKNPNKIIDIIESDDRMVPPSFLLHDLAEKIKNPQAPHHDCVRGLHLLYVRCLPRLVESCIYTVHDLSRCIDAAPTYANDVLRTLVSKRHVMQRVIDSSLTQSPQKTLQELIKKFPAYAAQLTDCFKQHYGYLAPTESSRAKIKDIYQPLPTTPRPPWKR